MIEEKAKRIEAEKKLMLKLLGLPVKRKVDTTLEEAMLRRTVHDLAFMRIELEDLQEKLAEEGWQDEYQNGENQSGTKASPSAKAYLDVQKLYNATVRHLKNLAAGTDIATDSLIDFLGA